MSHDPSNLYEFIAQTFDRDALARICTMHESEFADAFEMTRIKVPQKAPSDFYAFKDNGASVLAVAHLDTVVDHAQRQCGFLDTAGGAVVYSGALDDRLGAYVILDLLPKMGINVDVLLTTGEEQGRSTASYFESEKDYNWIIEFDRGGTDVVMYQYEDEETCELVEMTGAKVGMGSFSDIAFLEHLGVKAFNWGVGYQDYHSVRGHAYLDDLFKMMEYFADFYDLNCEERLPHDQEPETEDDNWGTWREDREWLTATEAWIERQQATS